MRHLNSSELACCAAMIFPTVPNNQTTPKAAAVIAVDIARFLIREADRVADELNKENDL